MKYTYKTFTGSDAVRRVCDFLNVNHIPPERIISLTPIEYHRYAGYGCGSEIRKVVLFYLEE